MRKEAGFEVTDRIRVWYRAEGRARKMFRLAAFADGVLAVSVQEGEGEGFTRELDLNGDAATVTIAKIG